MTAASARPARMAAPFLSLLLALSASLAKAEVYRNEEYGIILTLPKGLSICRVIGDPPHDHGPIIFLDPNDSNICGDSRHRRSVDIWATYNVTDESKTLEGLFTNWVCRDAPRIPCSAAPPGLRIGALRSLAGRVDYPDGWSDVGVVTQGGHWSDPLPGDAPYEVNYIVTLRTDRVHLRDDLRTFRRVLRGIRLTEPE